MPAPVDSKMLPSDRIKQNSDAYEHLPTGIVINDEPRGSVA
jgi:hypothetical protein